MIWKTTLAFLVDKASLFYNKNNGVQSSTFFKSLTILLIFFGGFFNISNTYSQVFEPDGNYDASEYVGGEITYLPTGNSTCAVQQIYSVVKTDDNGSYLLLGLYNGNSGAALFRYYLDTDPNLDLVSETYQKVEYPFPGADVVLQINANDDESFMVYKWNGSSLELNNSTNLKIKTGNFIGADGQFIEIKVPLSGDGSVIDLCNLADGGIINLGSYLSFKGANLNSDVCGGTNIDLDINVTGNISGSTAYCSGSSNSTILNLTGSFGAVNRWQKNEGSDWIDISNNTTTYEATDVAVTTSYRAIIVNNTCPDNEVVTGIATITINSMDDASFSYSPSSYCSDSNDPSPTITGVSGGSFSSTSGLIINSSSGIIDLDASTSGTYIIQYSTGNAGTCTNTSTQSVTITKTPVITNPGAQSGCDSYTLPAILGDNLSGTQAYYNNSQANGGTVITGPITNTQTVWIYDANGSCSDEESFEVTIQPAPNAGTNGILTVCEGTTPTEAELFAQLGGTPDTNGSWSNEGSVYTYTVTATGTCAVDATATVTVTEDDAPDAGTNGTLTVCEGTTPTEAELFAQLGGTPDANGSWSNEGSVYTYTVTATGTCAVDATATVTVTEDEAPDAGTNGTLTVCEGTTPTDAELFAQLGGTPDANGSWSNEGLVYTYTVEATGTCTEDASATVTVSVDAAPNAGTNGTLTVCEGTDITEAMLFAQLGSADAGGTWSTPVDGVYTYTVEATGTCTEDASATVTVTEQLVTAPLADTVTQPTCDVETGSFSITAVEGLQYSLNGGAYAATTSFDGLAPGTYTLTARNASGCVSEAASVTINAAINLAAPVIASTVQPDCETVTGSFTVVSQSGVSYSINGTDYQTAAQFTGLAPGSYNVTGRNEAGCISAATIVVIVEAEETTPIQTDTEDLCIEDETFDLNDLLLGDYDESGTWEDPAQTGGLTGSIIDPTRLAVGNYTFNYVLGGNCPSTTVVAVSINDDCVVLAPCSRADIIESISKAVTPNGDDHNDFFTIDVDSELECDYTYNVKIFNRWGSEVFAQNNYRNNWDGQSNRSVTSSNQLPSGTYYYIVEINGSPFEPIQGYIFLGTK